MNNTKVCLINQTSGLGDIMFAQKIAYIWNDADYQVLWPVESVNYDTVKRMDSSSFIDFVDPKEHFFRDDLFYLNGRDKGYEFYRQTIQTESFIYIPLVYGFDIMVGGEYHSSMNWSNFDTSPIMQSKYLMCGVDYNDWSSYLNFERDLERESALFDLLELDPKKEDYALVNLFFSSESKYQILPPTISKDLRTISMSTIDGFTLFDWCGVIENSAEFHTVCSSPLFMIDVMDSYGDLFVYPRIPFQDYTDLQLVMNMFTAPWIVR
jgi:hypothetical protein